MRIAVTGAGGYLGGRLVEAAPAGAEVRSLVRRPAPWLPGEVRVIGSLEQDAAAGLEGVDAVVHLAGANEVAAAADPDGSLAATVSAARAVARAAAANGVTRTVLVSTVHVYGEALRPGAVVDEDTRPEPLSPYATARLCAEHTMAEAGAPGLVVIRLTNGVGAPADRRVDRWSLVANDLCRQAATGPVLQLKSSGHQWRDFVALADATRILLAAARGQVPPGMYNLGSGRPTTILELARLVSDAAVRAGLERPRVAPGDGGPAEPAEPYRVSVGRLAEQGWGATVPLAQALDETMRFCLAHAEPSRERRGEPY